ncbi:MAG TPA: TonB-dependent receptor [Bacteroidales bacterium]|nr:TonB-dependent receptor [Bacteroidales bacterium]
MKKVFTLIFTCSIALNIIAQDQLTQTVRGSVTSIDPESEIFNASIFVVGSDPLIGTTTDQNNEFSFKVPTGRQVIEISCIGFETKQFDVLVTSGREVIIEAALHPSSIQLGDVEVVAQYDKSKPINSLSYAGARSFSVEETYRFASSLGDPARMVRSFAGVIPVNDSRNDLIIRGNAPIGVQWIIDGIEITNPNHFNTGIGMTGGQVTLLNTNLLSNSDFHLSAWPAPYGNALAGIFDLNVRSGNNKKREFWLQAGYNGIEAGAEGYFSKKSNSSYLVSYRYSIPDLMKKMGMKVPYVPKYQDLTLKTDFELNKKNTLSILGIWGTSNINFTIDEEMSELITEDDNVTFYQRVEVNSIAYVFGGTHKVKFSPKTELKSTVSFVRSDTRMPVDTMNMVDPNAEWQLLWHESAAENKYSAYSELTHRFSYNSRIIGGVKYDLYDFNYLEKTNYEYFPSGIITDEKGEFNLFRAYAQYVHNLSSKFSLTGGVFSMYKTLNDKYSVEPRGGIKYTPAKNHTFALSGGLYSQMQPRSFYFIQTPTANGFEYSNKNLDFSRSAQIDMFYDWAFAANWHTKIELYYQHLYGIPVKNDPNSYWTMLQAGGAGENYIIREDNLVNKGTGRNYGVEFTLEKFFSKNYYILFNSTIYNSSYTNGFNNKRWSTVFDGKYLMNLASGYEFNLKNNWTLFADLKGSWAGGTRYTPILIEESEAKGEIVLDTDNINSLKLKDYFRIDLRLGYRKNHKRFSEELAIDLQNLTNRRNIMGLSYDLQKHKYVEMLLQGFTPMVTYKIYFSL